MSERSTRVRSPTAWWGPAVAVTAVAWGAQQFAPLLLVYRHELGVGATAVQGAFATYVVGLVPGLLFGGPVSDRCGRRPVVLVALAASAAASVLLLAGGGGVGWLFAGRLVAGFASGAVFSAGTAWLRELSGGPDDGGPRRATVAMTAGFGLGPLVAGVLAQWHAGLDRTVLPYLPHVALALVALLVARRAPETRLPDVPTGLLQHLRLPEVRSRQFRTVVVPLAPWVFAPVAVAVAYLPGIVEPRLGRYALLFGTLVTLLCAAAGIAVAPVARRLDLRGAGPAVTVIGLLVAAAAAAATSPLLVAVAAVVLGAGYGCCQVHGLTEVQRLARPGHLGGLTAAYQAVSYVGFAASVPLAALDSAVPPAALLLGLAALAALTLVVTGRTSRS